MNQRASGQELLLSLPAGLPEVMQATPSVERSSLEIDERLCPALQRVRS